MNYTSEFGTQENRSQAAIGSFVFHAVLFAILFFTVVKANLPEEMGGGGIEVALGAPDQGSPDQSNMPKGTQLDDPTQTEESKPEPVKESKPEPEPERAKPAPSKPAPPTKTDIPKNTPTVDDPDVAAIKKEKEEKKRKEQAESSERARKQAEATAEANRKAEAASAVAAAEKAKKDAYDKAKNKAGGAFGTAGGSGTGSGAGTKPGQGGTAGGKVGGDPFGDGGSGGGSGGGAGGGTGVSIGGGLGGRAIQSRPKVSDNSQKTGKVSVQVCVDSNGDVSSADYTQKGSDTADGQLRQIAVDAARKFKFAKSDFDKQCGTITFTFKVK